MMCFKNLFSRSVSIQYRRHITHHIRHMLYMSSLWFACIFHAIWRALSLRRTCTYPSILCGLCHFLRVVVWVMLLLKRQMGIATTLMNAIHADHPTHNIHWRALLMHRHALFKKISSCCFWLNAFYPRHSIIFRFVSVSFATNIASALGFFDHTLETNCTAMLQLLVFVCSVGYPEWLIQFHSAVVPRVITACVVC